MYLIVRYLFNIYMQLRLRFFWIFQKCHLYELGQSRQIHPHDSNNVNENLLRITWEGGLTVINITIQSSKKINQLVSQSVNQTSNETIGHQVRQSDSQSVSNWISRSVSLPVCQYVHLSVCISWYLKYFNHISMYCCRVTHLDAINGAMSSCCGKGMYVEIFLDFFECSKRCKQTNNI